MPVRTDHPGHRIADRHAVSHLVDGIFFVLTEYLERTVLVLLCLRGDFGGHRCLFCRDVFCPRHISERAPRRLPAPLTYAAIRFDARSNAKLAGPYLVWIFTHDVPYGVALVYPNLIANVLKHS